MADLSSDQKEVLGILSEILADSSFTVLSMLLGKDIDLMPIRSDYLTAGEVEQEGWPSVIACRAEFTKGVSGHVCFLFNIKDATSLIDLMLGGEGESASELDEDSADALNETINQIMGATSQSLAERGGVSVAIDQVAINVGTGAEFVSGEMNNAEFGGIEFSMMLDTLIDSKMFVGIDATLLDALTALLMEQDEPEEAMPTPEAAPQPTATAPAMAAAPAAMAPQSPLMPQKGYENIDLLLDIELPVTIRIGKTELLLQDILKLTPGAIVELNKNADDPIDMLVNKKLVARGEVVVVEGNFAFRISEIVSTTARIRSLGG